MTTFAQPETTFTATDWAAVAREIGPALYAEAAERDRTGEISFTAFDTLRTSGITSAMVPVAFGGGGATHAEMGAVLRELASHDPSTAVSLAMHTHLVATQVWRHNHGMDASKVFGRVVGDHAVLVSTGASDWVVSNGSAVRVDGGYRVSARKAPASGCEVGNVVVTSIRWEDAPDGAKVIHCAIPLRADPLCPKSIRFGHRLRAMGSHSG